MWRGSRELVYGLRWHILSMGKNLYGRVESTCLWPRIKGGFKTPSYNLLSIVLNQIEIDVLDGSGLFFCTEKGGVLTILF